MLHRMDYKKWGAEYLEESRALKKRADMLRKRLPAAEGEEWILLNWRISTLREMYLECLHTGNELLERGRRYENGTEKTEFGALRL